MLNSKTPKLLLLCGRRVPLHHPPDHAPHEHGKHQRGERIEAQAEEVDLGKLEEAKHQGGSCTGEASRRGVNARLASVML